MTVTFRPTDYDVFGGLDVDKRSISVTFTNHQGFIRSLRVLTTLAMPGTRPETPGSPPPAPAVRPAAVSAEAVDTFFGAGFCSGTTAGSVGAVVVVDVS